MHVMLVATVEPEAVRVLIDVFFQLINYSVSGKFFF